MQLRRVIRSYIQDTPHVAALRIARLDSFAPRRLRNTPIRQKVEHYRNFGCDPMNMRGRVVVRKTRKPNPVKRLRSRTNNLT